jgi:hypothetical protein
MVVPFRTAPRLWITVVVVIIVIVIVDGAVVAGVARPTPRTLLRPPAHGVRRASLSSDQAVPAYWTVASDGGVFAFGG